MPKISIIIASVREGRRSDRIALYFKRYLESRSIAEVELLDLHIYNFPLFHERLKYQKNPEQRTLEFAAKIKSSDGIIIVTPEYNGGYPASLKNVIDLLYAEWKRKPVAISTVSDGQFGGMQVITSLEYILWKIGAMVVPAMFPVPRVQENFDEEGNALNPDSADMRAGLFIKELLWCMGKS